MKILRVKGDRFAKEVRAVAAALRMGKAVVCPTDTVYGLLADATNKNSVRKVFEIKKREKEKALPVFVKSIAMAKRLAIVSKKQEARPSYFLSAGRPFISRLMFSVTISASK